MGIHASLPYSTDVIARCARARAALPAPASIHRYPGTEPRTERIACRRSAIETEREGWLVVG